MHIYIHFNNISTWHVQLTIILQSMYIYVCMYRYIAILTQKGSKCTFVLFLFLFNIFDKVFLFFNRFVNVHKRDFAVSILNNVVGYIGPTLLVYVRKYVSLLLVYG